MLFKGVETASTLSPAKKRDLLADALHQQGLDAYWMPPEDEHLNEYLPEGKKRIEWLTGFTGESAPVLATPKSIHLFVDGRFHIQVDDEVDADVVTAHKLTLNEPASKVMAAVLSDLKATSGENVLRVGYDPFITSPARLEALQHAVSNLSIQWLPVNGNLVDRIRPEFKPPAADPAFLFPREIAGKTVVEKTALIRDRMRALNVTILPLTRLDEVGWLFNLGANDVPYNPVLEAYAVLTPDRARLFTDLDKLPRPVRDALAEAGVTVSSYTEYAASMTILLADYAETEPPTVLLDKDSLTMGTLQLLEGQTRLVEARNPVLLEKALKNPVEVERMALANFRASRAIIRHLAWTSQMFDEGKPLNEETLRADIESKYREEPEFTDLSFPTIPGIGPNSAIIHYSHADPDSVADFGLFYLVDSGAHYLGGTTDTTRTTVFGQPQPDQQERFTRVLQAHIACASLRFPKGTNGAQIDAVCRAPMWRAGLDFGHGTGHGVGIFNVHEGPNRISSACREVFLPGMITSIEPGYYEKNWGGIRLENLYVVRELAADQAPDSRSWLQFESLTFVPFERKLIDPALLGPDETAWLNRYNRHILDKILPTLTETWERTWLEKQCAPFTG